MIAKSSYISVITYLTCMPRKYFEELGIGGLYDELHYFHSRITKAENSYMANLYYELMTQLGNRLIAYSPWRHLVTRFEMKFRSHSKEEDCKSLFILGDHKDGNG